MRVAGAHRTCLRPGSYGLGEELLLQLIGDLLDQLLVVGQEDRDASERVVAQLANPQRCRTVVITGIPSHANVHGLRRLHVAKDTRQRDDDGFGSRPRSVGRHDDRPRLRSVAQRGIVLFGNRSNANIFADVTAAGTSRACRQGPDVFRIRGEIVDERSHTQRGSSHPTVFPGRFVGPRASRRADERHPDQQARAAGPNPEIAVPDRRDPDALTVRAAMGLRTVAPEDVDAVVSHVVWRTDDEPGGDQQQAQDDQKDPATHRGHRSSLPPPTRVAPSSTLGPTAVRSGSPIGTSAFVRRENRLMATIHIDEIEAILRDRGEPDAVRGGPSGFFLELRFDREGEAASLIDIGAADPEFVNRVLTADCPSGSVTIVFDEAGQLRSLDIS